MSQYYYLDIHLIIEMNDVYKALADPNRRRILQLLRHGDKTVGEIGTELKVTGATLSHHLDILKRADLIQSRREGKFIWYSIHTSVFEDVLSHLSSFFSPSSHE